MTERDLEARIAVLSDALKSISKNTCCDNCQEAARVARSALGAYVGLARDHSGDVAQTEKVRRADLERLANKIERQDVEFKIDGGFLADSDAELICAVLRAASQPPAAPVTFQQSELKSAATVETDHRGSSAGTASARNDAQAKADFWAGQAEKQPARREHFEIVSKQFQKIADALTGAEPQRSQDAADAARYRHLKEHASYYYAEGYNPPSPREFGIAWEHQDSTPDRPSMDWLIDQEIEAKRLEALEDEAEDDASSITRPERVSDSVPAALTPAQRPPE